MPTPRPDEERKDFISRCIPIVIEDGTAKDGAQGAAVCNSMWEEAMEEKSRTTEGEESKSSIMLPMLMTKAESMADGRVRWQARANSGNFDLLNDRFARSFWEDVIGNFGIQQEAVSRGQLPPDPLPIPILDPAHYSLKTEPRDIARGGYPIKLWTSGKALMAQGYFDNSPLGRAMAKAAEDSPVEDRRVSICVMPDYGNVERVDGMTTYKGGRGRAYLDHLAMTSMPIDPDTAMAIKSEVAMSTQKEDALAVLGEDGKELVDQLEDAKTKAASGDVLIKATDEEATDVDETETTEPDTAEAAETDAEPVDEEPETSEPDAEQKSMTADDLKGVLGAFTEALGKSIDERLGKLETATQERMDQMDAQVKALAANETTKIKAAVDGNGEWWEKLAKSISDSSVQRREPVEDGTKAKGPAATSEHAEYRSRFNVPPQGD